MSTHHHGHHGHHGHGHPPAGIDWDARYAEKGQIWSGEPNAALVTEVASLKPGSVLDVGCGEGADAIWLAKNGWQVTALDVSAVALARARAAAAEKGVAVTWVQAGLVEAGLPSGSFDLVSVFYAPLARTPDATAERALGAAVSPGGVLLVVHHADFAPRPGTGHGFRAEDYVSPADVRDALGDDWRIEVFERRRRDIHGGEGAHHVEDVVLRARRTTGG